MRLMAVVLLALLIGVPVAELRTLLGGFGVVPHSVPLEKLLPGGPPKDGIPSIDRPRLESAEEGSRWLFPDDVVLGLEHRGEARAYPIRILDWHELVNDNVAGNPILVSYCPLCGTGLAFEAKVEGQPTQFGVSGLLYNSDLVMYDRRTQSLWHQITGEAIVGPRTGDRLKTIPMDAMRWSEWRTLHPETKVLSRDTGHGRDYSVSPYGNYDRSPAVIFPVDRTDDRYHPKAPIVFVNVGGRSKAYPVEELRRAGGVANDVFQGRALLAFLLPGTDTPRVFSREVGGRVLEFNVEGGNLTDNQGNTWGPDGVALRGPDAGARLERFVSIPAFWFAWAAVNPEGEVFRAP